MRSKSLSRLPQKKPVNNQYDIVSHRKQIQGTLKELHILQSQIYDLNVADNPHSSSPVKKQIKQLSYLYENMVKPKEKNSLNIKSRDIELALRIMNKDYDQNSELDKQMLEQPIMLMNTTAKQKNNLSSLKDVSYKMPKDTLNYKFNQITNQDLNVDFVTQGNSGTIAKNQQELSVKELFNFLNYTECDDFDPIEQAYKMFLNPQTGKFDNTIYNEYSKILGLPPIKYWNTFLSGIHQLESREQAEDPTTITLAQFKLVFQMSI